MRVRRVCPSAFCIFLPFSLGIGIAGGPACWPCWGRSGCGYQSHPYLSRGRADGQFHPHGRAAERHPVDREHARQGARGGARPHALQPRQGRRRPDPGRPAIPPSRRDDAAALAAGAPGGRPAPTVPRGARRRRPVQLMGPAPGALAALDAHRGARRHAAGRGRPVSRSHDERRRGADRHRRHVRSPGARRAWSSKSCSRSSSSWSRPASTRRSAGLAPDGRPGAGYVFVDWGADFKRQHGEAFPDLETPAVAVGLGALGLSYILSNGGTGYFPKRIVRGLLADRRLHEVAGAPQFGRPAFMVYPASKPRPDWIDTAIVGLRHVASLEAED